MLQLHLSDQQFYCLRFDLYYRFEGMFMSIEIYSTFIILNLSYYIIRFHSTIYPLNIALIILMSNKPVHGWWFLLVVYTCQFLNIAASPHECQRLSLHTMCYVKVGRWLDSLGERLKKKKKQDLLNLGSKFTSNSGDHSGNGPAQWETTFQGKIVSHWLSLLPKWSQKSALEYL